MHFAERFFLIYHEGLIAAEPAEGDQDWGETENRLSELFRQEEKLTLPPGVGAADRMEALTPIFLWLDERFLRSARPDAGQWLKRSFQTRYLATNQGGELFFDGLTSLLERRAAQMGPVPQGGGLADLWVGPGGGLDPLEGILDCYALSLVLGYAGRYYQGDQELLALRDKAKEQLAAWGAKSPSKPPPRRRWLSDFWLHWRGPGWILFYVAVPLAILFLLWLRRSSVVESLPF
jgi:hypothetical protein